mgnify:CR=1 FL=1
MCVATAEYSALRPYSAVRYNIIISPCFNREDLRYWYNRGEISVIMFLFSVVKIESGMRNMEKREIL